MKNKKWILPVIATCLLTSSLTHALEFKRSCEPAEDTLVIGGVGDLLIHKYIHNAAQNQKSHYSFLWKNIKKHVQSMDIMYANLETPLAGGLARDYTLHKDPGVKWDSREYIYSGYPAFNTPPEMAKNLKEGGFDIVSTANNHASDRGRLGIDMTIDSLENAGLAYTGTRRKGSNKSYTTIVNKKGWRVAFISCTYGLSGPSNRAILAQVLHCYSQKELLLSEIRQARKIADAVIVTPHWGTENTHKPNSHQRSLTQDIAEAGADVIIGTHSHQIQPTEKYITRNGREVPVVYGTGNFVSSQPGINKLGLMVVIGLSRKGNDVWVNGARYLPLWMTRSYLSVDFLDRLKGHQSTWNVVSRVMQDDFGLMNSREDISTNPFCN